MTRTQRLLIVLLVTGFAVLGGLSSRRARAQTISVPFSYSVGTATHTSCPVVVASTTQYCFPSDGPYVSISGAAWQAIPLTATTSGVASVQVCNASGSSCGTAQTGAVVLDIPKTATTTVTVTAPVATATTTVN